MKRWLAATAMACTGVLAVACASSAAEEVTPPLAPAAPPPTEFTGTCRYEGVVVFDEPIGALPMLNRLTLKANGTCTGSLDGAYVADARTEWHAEARGLMSCGEGVLSGPGRMIVGGETISLTFTELRATGVGKLVFTGDDGGALHGLGSTSGDLAVTIEQCAQGSGTLSRVEVFGQLAGGISG